MSSAKVEAYARALVEIAQAEGGLDRVEDELFRMARAFESNDQLRATLSDTTIPAERRQQVVEQLLGGKASATTIQLVTLIVAAGQVRDLPAIIDVVVREASQGNSQSLAEVRSAVALSDDQQKRLAAALTKATGKDVEVKVVIDPSVLGGIVTQIGDTVIDGSVRHRLDKMREALA